MPAIAGSSANDASASSPRGFTPGPFASECAISTLESQGLMREMTDRLAADSDLAVRYRSAHEDYLRRRAVHGAVAEIEGVSAGGMPDRVKCLHVLVGHSLAAGRGVNPLGDEAIDALRDVLPDEDDGDWGTRGPCT